MNLDDENEKAVAEYAEKNGCTIAAARQFVLNPPKLVSEKPRQSIPLEASDGGREVDVLREHEEGAGSDSEAGEATR